MLLWLWRRPLAIAPIQPLVWEPPYAVGAAQEKAKRQKKKKKKKKKNILTAATELRVAGGFFLLLKRIFSEPLPTPPSFQVRMTRPPHRLLGRAHPTPLPGDPGKPLVPGKPCNPLMPRMPGRPVGVPQSYSQESGDPYANQMLSLAGGGLPISAFKSRANRN